MIGIGKYINITLILIACLITCWSMVKMNNSNRKLAYVEEALNERIQTIKTHRSNCEKIWGPSDYGAMDAMTTDSILAQTKDDYHKLKKEIELLEWNLGLLSAHTAMVIKRYKFFRDVLTREVYCGFTESWLTGCEKYSWKINTLPFIHRNNNSYSVPITNSLNLKFSKITYDISKMKIDTFALVRTEKLN